MGRRFKSVFEREERGFIQKFEIAFSLLVWIGIAWLGFNSGDQSIRNIAFGFNIMMTIVAVFWLLDLVQKSNVYGESVGLGSKQHAVVGALAGLVFAFAFFSLGSGSQSVIVPFAISTLAPFVLLAAFVEETFFRSVLAPTLARFFENDWAGWIGNFVLFAGFHFLAYGAAVPAMVIAGIFGTIMLLGNTVLKSTSFGYTAHIVYNFIVIGGFAALVVG